MIDWLIVILAFVGSFAGAMLALWIDRRAKARAEALSYMPGSRYRRSDKPENEPTNQPPRRTGL